MPQIKRHWIIEYSPTIVLAALALTVLVGAYFIVNRTHTCPYCKEQIEPRQWNQDMDCCYSCTRDMLQNIDEMSKNYLKQEKELEKRKREGW